MAPNAGAVGLDMAHEINRQSARDTGKAQITGPITFVQDTAKTPGLLFYAPFYAGGHQGDVQSRRKNFVGMVYAPFVMSKILDGTLSKENRFVSLSIRDNSDVLYDDNATKTVELDPNPVFTKTMSTELYGRTWTFDIASNMAFRDASTNNQPLVILVGGVLIDCMLLALFVFLTRSSRHAVKFSDKMSENYDEKSN